MNRLLVMGPNFGPHSCLGVCFVNFFLSPSSCTYFEFLSGIELYVFVIWVIILLLMISVKNEEYLKVIFNFYS